MSLKAAPEDHVRLLVGRTQMAEELEKQIAAGQELQARAIGSFDALDDAKGDLSAWRDYTTELLKRRFSNPSIANQFFGSYSVVFGIGTSSSLETEIEILQDDIRAGSRALRQIQSKLELIDEPQPANEAKALADREFGSKVFLVHGHNKGWREEVARRLERLEIAVVILHEQPNQGRTLIEKFEQQTSEVGFAVVLATADDLCVQKPEGGEKRESPKPRARQNVVFEAGFFFGALGRGRTAILYEEGVDLPTDLSGIAYIQLAEGWEFSLAKEIKAAGFQMDLNKLL